MHIVSIKNEMYKPLKVQYGRAPSSDHWGVCFNTADMTYKVVRVRGGKEKMNNVRRISFTVVSAMGEASVVSCETLCSIHCIPVNRLRVNIGASCQVM